MQKLIVSKQSYQAGFGFYTQNQVEDGKEVALYDKQGELLSHAVVQVFSLRIRLGSGFSCLGSFEVNSLDVSYPRGQAMSSAEAKHLNEKAQKYFTYPIKYTADAGIDVYDFWGKVWRLFGGKGLGWASGYIYLFEKNKNEPCL